MSGPRRGAFSRFQTRSVVSSAKDWITFQCYRQTLVTSGVSMPGRGDRRAPGPPGRVAAAVVGVAGGVGAQRQLDEAGVHPVGGLGGVTGEATVDQGRIPAGQEEQ